MYHFYCFLPNFEQKGQGYPAETWMHQCYPRGPRMQSREREEYSWAIRSDGICLARVWTCLGNCLGLIFPFFWLLVNGNIYPRAVYHCIWKHTACLVSEVNSWEFHLRINHTSSFIHTWWWPSKKRYQRVFSLSFLSFSFPFLSFPSFPHMGTQKDCHLQA